MFCCLSIWFLPFQSKPSAKRNFEFHSPTIWTKGQNEKKKRTYNKSVLGGQSEKNTNKCVCVVSVIHTITARFNRCRDIDTHHQTYCDEPSEEKKNPNSIGRISQGQWEMMNFLEFMLLTKLNHSRYIISCDIGLTLRGERLSFFSLLDQHFTANLNKQAVLIWKYHETIVRVWTSTTWRITDYLRRSNTS